MELQAFLMIALPALMGLLAIGAVLMIKTQRRQQGATPDTVANAVPVNPMSAGHAARLRRRYVAGAGIVLALLAALGAALALSAG